MQGLGALGRTETASIAQASTAGRSDGLVPDRRLATAPAATAPRLVVCRGGGSRGLRRTIGTVLLQRRPPVGELAHVLAGLGAQQQEVIGGAEAGMLEQTRRALSGVALQARLQHPDLPHLGREATRQDRMAALLLEHLARSLLERRYLGHPAG